jgi:hypothetical protein
MIFLNFFRLLWVIFTLLDPDPDSEYGSGSTDLIETGSITELKKTGMFRKGSMCVLPGVLSVGGWRGLAQAVGRIVGVHVLEASQLLLLLGGGRGRRQRPQLHLLIKFIKFFIFEGHFCPPESGSGLRIQIPLNRIHSGSGSTPDPDPLHYYPLMHSRYPICLTIFGFVMGLFFLQISLCVSVNVNISRLVIFCMFVYCRY